MIAKVWNDTHVLRNDGAWCGGDADQISFLLLLNAGPPGCGLPAELHAPWGDALSA